MMFDLPSDLLEEIISRIPATSFKRLRSTCKLLNDLFKNPRFIEKHFSKAPKESLVLMLKEYRVCPMSVNLNVVPPSIEFKGGLGLKDSHSYLEEVDIDRVIHCDGLLLCTTKNSRLVVWNPCLGQTRWIQPKTSYEWYSKFALGYEKKKSGRNHKILMYWDRHDDIYLNEFEIYEFSSDSWRVLEDVAFDDCSILSDIGVSLKGNCYWIAYDWKNIEDFLLCFDFTTERFKRTCLPVAVVNVGQMALSVVGEKQLSMLSVSYSSLKREIWVTDKIDTDDTKSVLQWSKIFTADVPLRGNYSMFFLSFLINEEKKVVLCCDKTPNIGENNVYIIGEDAEYYTKIHYEESTNERWWYPFIFNYVPSLVQLE